MINNNLHLGIAFFFDYPLMDKPEVIVDLVNRMNNIPIDEKLRFFQCGLNGTDKFSRLKGINEKNLEYFKKECINGKYDSFLAWDKKIPTHIHTSREEFNLSLDIDLREIISGRHQSITISHKNSLLTEPLERIINPITP